MPNPIVERLFCERCGHRLLSIRESGLVSNVRRGVLLHLGKIRGTKTCGVTEAHCLCGHVWRR